MARPSGERVAERAFAGLGERAPARPSLGGASVTLGREIRILLDVHY
jgi:hypothetical protein